MLRTVPSQRQSAGHHELNGSFIHACILLDPKFRAHEPFARGNPHRYGDNMKPNLSHCVLENWSRAGLVTALILLLLAPLVYVRTGVPQLLIFLWLPFYMLHQYEEHG